MDVTEAVKTRIEVREYTDEPVDDETKRAILEAGRLAPSGRNLQHWQFILVDDDEVLADLAERSPTGSWIAGADFAIVILTDPSVAFNELDAGRAVTHMQLTAWEHGVGSCIYTVDDPRVDELLGVPDEYDVTVVAGFGYPVVDIAGRKDRVPLSEIAARNAFDVALRVD